ncbi:surface antigen, partial [Plasmodium falciparum UGT5.1]
NHKNTTHHTPKISTTRLLCECELYAPSNYDNDSQMKEVMQDFDRQTSQRFEEYNERMMKNRQKCKEQCNKEIQKIILKDKLEKELMDKIVTLDTDIQSDAIPTCVCEKSVADKVEKTCLRCGSVFGGGIAPSVGLLGGIGEAAISAWKVAALKAAIVSAKKAGAAKGLAEGNAHAMNMVITFLKGWSVDELIPEIFNSFVSTNRYTELANIAGAIVAKKAQICADGLLKNPAMCRKIDIKFGLSDASGKPNGLPPNRAIPQMINGLAGKAEQAAVEVAKDTSQSVAAKITEQQTAVINATYYSWQIAITASIIAIVVIILIMVIIYLILRYRRKKKMKKKLQYIKLLEE